MNEIKKTGIFWGIAAATVLLAAIFAWPRSASTTETGYVDVINFPLFPKFKDPLNAASLKIVTFDEEQGEMGNFEVRKDAESGVWTIPSKGNYPADAVQQMRIAANLLVDLKVLDVPTDNPEDHSGMGVLEPKLEDLDVGDEGVGRLVTFKDKTQQVLGSLIIGNEVSGQAGKIYVRKPGQDPVYVVALDDQPLTTQFGDWIEEDLLQLSSIDLEDVTVKDYSATLGVQGVALSRNYNIELSKDGATWDLAALKEFDKSNPLAEPTVVDVDADKELNTTKLNDLANALDDLKFVDVKRKPDGISANLRADKDFASDNEAARELVTRGFIPVPLGKNGEIELLSANGELTATTKAGVQYILRFGNISGIADDSAEDGEEETTTSGGVNRYLMVSTTVDESKFPPPDLKPIPQTLEDLEALDKPAPPEGVDLPPELNPAMQDAESESGEATPAEEKPVADEKMEAAKQESGDEPGEASAKTNESEKTTTEPGTESDPAGEPSGETETGPPSGEKVDTKDIPAEGSTEASGEGETGGVGEAQAQEGDDQAAKADEQAAEDDKAAADEKAETAGEETGEAEMKANEEPAEAEPPVIEETKEEKLERLAAVQEKITKENERKLEERKEKLEEAKRLSRNLNERFADWYYVIPEDTYAKLRVSREELFDTSDGPANRAAAPPGMPMGMPPFGN